MKIDCHSCKSPDCFVRMCSSDLLDKLNESKIVEKYLKGQYIFNEGTFATNIYFIHSGKVKVVREGFVGKQLIVRLAANGHVLGHRGFGHDVYSVSAVAMENSELCSFTNVEFNKALLTDIKLTYNLMQFFSIELRMAENKMKNLSQMTVHDKVADALLLCAKSFGKKTKDSDQILIDAEITRKDFADIAGIRTEQFIRELSEFKKEKIVSIKEKKIKLCDIEKLHKILSPYY